MTSRCLVTYKVPANEVTAVSRAEIDAAAGSARSAGLTVVRLAIVPAVLALLGHRAWWLPRWLDQILPVVDVEGAKLDRGTMEKADERMGAYGQPG